MKNAGKTDTRSTGEKLQGCDQSIMQTGCALMVLGFLGLLLFALIF